MGSVSHLVPIMFVPWNTSRGLKWEGQSGVGVLTDITSPCLQRCVGVVATVIGMLVLVVGLEAVVGVIEQWSSRHRTSVMARKFTHFSPSPHHLASCTGPFCSGERRPLFLLWHRVNRSWSSVGVRRHSHQRDASYRSVWLIGMHVGSCSIVLSSAGVSNFVH